MFFSTTYRRFFLALFVLSASHFVFSHTALAAPSLGTANTLDAVPTFHSIGLYWAPQGMSANGVAHVEYRRAGDPTYQKGLDLWFDGRNTPSPEYRGSIVELQSGTAYEIRLTLEDSTTHAIIATETLPSGNRPSVSTWNEKFPEGQTVIVPAGTTHLVINAADSGTPTAYKVYTAPAGQNLIDQSGVPTQNMDDSCVVVNGASYVIIRGLVLANCKREGVLLNPGSHDIVIENNEIKGWGGIDSSYPGTGDINQYVFDGEAAVYCNNWDSADASHYFDTAYWNAKVSRIVVQRNRMHDPRWWSYDWGTHGHPAGPQAVYFNHCGTNHVIRYNEVSSPSGHYYNDGIGGADNYTPEGFPFADSDIYGNKISEVHDDGIEAEGANRNVRIWGNYFNNIAVVMGNATTSVGPLYIWRNVSNQLGGIKDTTVNADMEDRGPFIKGGGNFAWGPGRAYYFHNTALQPPPQAGSNPPQTGSPSQTSMPSHTMGAGWGINKSGNERDDNTGAFSNNFFNFVSRNNIWQIHDTAANGSPDFASIMANAENGPIDINYDLYNGRLLNGSNQDTLLPPEPNGNKDANGNTVAVPVPKYDTKAALGDSGNYFLDPTSPGYHAAAVIPNFNDRFKGTDGQPIAPDVGAHQSGTPAMQFGVNAYMAPTARITATPSSGTVPLNVSFSGADSSPGSSAIATYHFDFGDSTGADGPQQSHTYAAAGTYTAVLTVIDINGLQSTASATVTVNDSQTPPSGGGSASPSAFELYVSVGPGLIASRAANLPYSISVTTTDLDTRTLKSVSFFVDGVLKATSTTSPFQFSWTPAATDTLGNHSLVIQATDTAGNVATESRTVLLLAGSCNIFTATSIMQGEPLNVRGVCSSSQNVQQLEFYVDTVLQNVDATAPYTWTADTSAFTVGNHTLAIKAKLVGGGEVNDSANVEIVAAPLTVTVSNGPVSAPLSPAASFMWNDKVTFTATATDGRAFKQVDFFFDGALVQGVIVSPYQYVWGPSSVRAYGRHVLQVRGTDLNGNVLTAQRDVYLTSRTCNVLVGTSKYVVANEDTVYAAPHLIAQGQPLNVLGLCNFYAGIQQVQFYLDGILQSTDAVAPYTWTLDTTALAVGTHTIAIKGLLPGGESNHSATIEIESP